MPLNGNQKEKEVEHSGATSLFIFYEPGTGAGCNMYIVCSIPISSKILPGSGSDNACFIPSGSKISAFTTYVIYYGKKNHTDNYQPTLEHWVFHNSFHFLNHQKSFHLFEHLFHLIKFHFHLSNLFLIFLD